jgi:hypothetical protein
MKNVEITQVLDIERHKKTTLTKYFETNKVNHEAWEISYADFPGSFTWNNMVKKWAKRCKGVAVRRFYFVSPTSGERYFLWTLLTIVKVPCLLKTFEPSTVVFIRHSKLLP